MKKLLFTLFLLPYLVYAQKAYFIDGFHGGIWGHYPAGYTSYIVEQLNRNPAWNINLEIEPETWKRDLKSDVAGFRAIRELLKDTSANSRIEYVNPAYGQPYMFNISGESIIRQFSYGMKMLTGYFPSITFRTYSSEEPCFTSALPQILKSFGYSYASLKNPNTCWGGYTRAYGRELVNWIGPDGTSILASPRYAIEALKPNSTWETIGNANSREFIASAFADGIKSPVGMCLQDAGWRFGPWLKGDFYKPTTYTTWRNYFENITDRTNVSDWKFTQEDVQTSLVWGAQVLQRLAQQTRIAENKVVQAEKIASLQKLEKNIAYPSASINDAWRNLMLAQHHDCWIVPYNRDGGNTWADKVKNWTNKTNQVADSIYRRMANAEFAEDGFKFRVYNTLGRERTEWLKVPLPKNVSDTQGLTMVDQNNKKLPVQVLKDRKSILFKARVPAMGYAVFELKKQARSIIGSNGKNATIKFLQNGDCILETDLYKIHIDKSKGGTIKSLVAKKLKEKEFIDADSERKFNELRGNFYKKGGFMTNTDQPARISVLENGPFMLSVSIRTEIAGNPVTQVITMQQGEPRIDCNLRIDWKGNEGIGEFEESNYKATTLRKAFYNDKYKLLTLFPLALKGQRVFKDAPFDVVESRLENTFFGSWDSIKNNVVFNWVDVLSGDKEFGMALFSDHVTSYSHGSDFPLALTTQYSGKALWGRNYVLDGPTEISYKLLPHMGDWQKAEINYRNEQIKEPLQAISISSDPGIKQRSFIESSTGALEISSCNFEGEDLYIRIFNAAKTKTKGTIKLNFNVSAASFVNLDGSKMSDTALSAKGEGITEIAVNLNPFGITTLKVSKQ
ncbi:glycoside hydrolase family 38 C-terminal domain-containing protein [Desertivirga xinjiangensis]|uniref:glycoside hydrolase family 38 C-terminal domain-containing protein n=1 Tax=Desertivirga xinjiangensis TaxID=539206 RepID=UPI002109CF38|nr:glycoside hydrolase family 38 C-terminal domain-containing protein [Pedobacter xinjiangensis]